jgi:hypothetical protein
MVSAPPPPLDDGPVTHSAVVTVIRRELARRRLPRPRKDNLARWCLVVAALLADRIVVAGEAELRRIENAIREAAGPCAVDLLAARTELAVGAGLLAG